MASFTDKVPTFNPYVQQLPIEEMVKVGMYKQQKYEEGVQKIQSNIDNVAGLDVANDADKQYLQSKLNALGNNLKTVAAGDFSDFSLVNSVNGMTKQITKDENVINAVSSTAWLRKQQAAMEKAIAEGKSSQENQWDFGEKASKYLNSTEVGAKFNGRYTQYVDVDKKWMEVMKSLHSDLAEQDIPYVRNSDGTINKQQTAAAMQRMSKETVSSAKIENALRSSLSADELNQLSITGRYTFRTLDTPEKLAVYSKTRFNSQIELNDKRIQELDGYCNLNSSNPEKQKEGQDIIDSLQIKNEKLKGQLNDELKYIEEDPDQAKAFIYKNGAIEQFANAYAWEHNKENLMTNPVLEAEHWEKTNALDKARLNLSVRSQNWTEYKGKFDMNMANQEYQLKVAKQQAELYGSTAPFETYLGENTNVKDPMSAMIDDEEAYDQAASQGIINMVKGIKGTNSTQIKNAILKYENGDPNWYKLGDSNTAKAIPVEWRDEVAEIIKNKKEAKLLKIGRTNIINEVEKSPEFVQQENDLNNKINSFDPIILKDRNGKNIVYSPKEIKDLVNKTKTIVEYNNKNGKPSNYKTVYTSALSNKEKMFVASNLKSHGDSIYRNIAKMVHNHKETVGKKKEEAIQAKVLERGGTYVPRMVTINFGSEDGNIARQKWGSIADAVLSRFAEGKGADARLTTEDIKLGKEWVSGEGKNNIIYKKLTQGNKTYLVMTNKGSEIFIPLESSEASQLPMIDPNEPTEQYKNVTKAQHLNNGYTNPTGKYEDAYFGRDDMPNSKLDIKADLRWSKSDSGKQFIDFKLNTPNGIVPIQLQNNPMSREDAIRFISQLTKDQVKQLYLKNSDVSDKNKAIIKNL